MTDRYRKKPVEVRAWKISFDGERIDWVREATTCTRSWTSASTRFGIGRSRVRNRVRFSVQSGYRVSSLRGASFKWTAPVAARHRGLFVSATEPTAGRATPWACLRVVCRLRRGRSRGRSRGVAVQRAVGQSQLVLELAGRLLGDLPRRVWADHLRHERRVGVPEHLAHFAHPAALLHDEPQRVAPAVGQFAHVLTSVE